MSNPVIADNKPMKMDLVKGQEYYLCACGRSKNQPYCDDSHKGTGINPVNYVAEQDGEAWLCMCKHSANFPICNGTHKQFSAEDVGKEGPGK